MHITSPEQLKGKSILNWVGSEIAFVSAEKIENVIWSHESVPYRQFLEIELTLNEGFKAKITAGLDSDFNYYCLSFSSSQNELEKYEPTNGDFIRVVTLENLPLGKVEEIAVTLSEQEQLVSLALSINGVHCEICCGEVIENEEQLFEVNKPQEFVLVGI